jgi:anti-sigma regulatory factor (Ser/Thr protein kinase)
MAKVTLRLTPQRAHVRTARLVAAAMARRSGVAEEMLDEVRLAVGEACGRAVQLHERYGLTESVVVTLADDDDRFKVVVRDHAPNSSDGNTPRHHRTPAGPGGGPRRWLDTSPVGPAASGASTPGAAVPDPAAPGESGSGPGDRLPCRHADTPSGEPAAGGPQEPGSGRDAAAVPGWLAPLDTGLDLALLDALVEDISIEPADGAAGTEVRMSWSIEQSPAGSDPAAGAPAAQPD